MIIPFRNYDYIKIGDIERCPYLWNAPEFTNWLREDDKRKLLIALDRYAYQITTLFKEGDRVIIDYYDRFAHGVITLITWQGCKVLFDGDYDLPYWYYKPEELRFEKFPNR